MAVLEVVGEDKVILAYGAERPFLLQCLGAFMRLGRPAEPLCLSAEGLKSVSKLNPKAIEVQSIHDTRVQELKGTLLWAPESALFSNSALQESELEEISDICKNYNGSILLCLPQSAFEVSHEMHSLAGKRALKIYFPPLVGFGDKNYYQSLLNSVFEASAFENPPNFPLLSLYDAIAIVVSATQMKLKNINSDYWVKGQILSGTDIHNGFEEFKKLSTQNLKLWMKKRFQRDKFSFALFPTEKRPELDTLRDFQEDIPAGYTPWSRFLRDAFRIYQSTPSGELVLHFGPVKGPSA